MLNVFAPALAEYAHPAIVAGLDADMEADMQHCLSILPARYDQVCPETGALVVVLRLQLQPATHVFRFQDEAFSEENFSSYLAQLAALYKSSEPFCLVFDFTLMRCPPMYFFWKQLEFLQKYAADARRCVVWSLLIVGSPQTRDLLSLMFSIVPPQRPIRVVDTATVSYDEDQYPRGR